MSTIIIISLLYITEASLSALFKDIASRTTPFVSEWILSDRKSFIPHKMYQQKNAYGTV